MSLQYRSHLWNAALLLAAITIALAADRLSAAPERDTVGAPTASPEISPFVAPLRRDSALPSFRQTVAVDPFERRGGRVVEADVASGEASPTVRTAPTARPQGGGRQLTAILIADERRVAVIDDATVRVGDVLRDGARVSAIQADRVWVVERDGRWQMLTLTARGR